MTYDEITAQIQQALALYKLSKDPLALDSVRVLQDLLADTPDAIDFTPSKMQAVALNYLNKMTLAQQTLGLDV